MVGRLVAPEPEEEPAELSVGGSCGLVGQSVGGACGAVGGTGGGAVYGGSRQ